MKNELLRYYTRSLEAQGYRLAKWAPGDGVTRYRIVPAEYDYDSAPSPWPSLTALGRREATSMVAAFVTGRVQVFRELQAHLGRDWNADTLNELADWIGRAGFRVRDSAEFEDRARA